MRTRVQAALVLTICLSLILVVACGAQGDGDTGTAEDQLSIAIPITDAPFAHVYVAQSLGYFDQEGVKVEIKAPVGANTVSLLASGEADLAMFGTGQALLPAAQGKPTSVIYNFAGGGAGGVLVVNGDLVKSGDVTSVGDLDGRRVGVLGVGGSSYGLAQRYQNIADIEYEIVPVGDLTSLVASLRTGKIDGAVGVISWFSEGLDQGWARVLVDTRIPEDRSRYVGGYFAESSIFGLTSTIENNQQALQKFTNAVQQANLWLHSSNERDIADTLLALPVFEGVDRQTQVNSARNAKAYYTPNYGFISSSLWELSLDHYSTWNLEGFKREDHPYDTRVDMQFVRESPQYEKFSGGQ